MWIWFWGVEVDLLGVVVVNGEFFVLCSFMWIVLRGLLKGWLVGGIGFECIGEIGVGGMVVLGIVIWCIVCFGKNDVVGGFIVVL